MSDYKIDTLEVESQIIAPAATPSVAGLQSATDKTKLDTVATGATANSTDAALRDRATHTGTQLSTTISDFTTAASTAAPVQSVAGQTGAVVLTKSDVGLANVDNTSDATKNSATATLTNKTIDAASNTVSNISNTNISATAAISYSKLNIADGDLTVAKTTGLQTALNNKYDASNPNGYQTASQVSATVAALVDAAPATLDTLNELAAALGGDPNFATTMTTALAGKEPTITAGTIGQYYRGDKSFQTLDKAAVGLNLVDNTSDLAKPISTLTQTALNNKYDASNPSGYQTSAQVTSTVSSAITTHESALNPHPIYETSAEAQAKVDAHANLTNNPHSVTKAQVGLGSVDNTSDLSKPISTATQSALDLKYDASNPLGFQTAAQVTSTVSAASTTDRARANHTGTQLSSTISDFSEAVDDRVATLLTAGSNITLTYNDVANTLTVASTSTSYTDEQAQDAVGTILTDTSSVDFTYNDVANTITAAVLPAGVNHNALQNYVANQHVDHSTVSITAGTGLSGGGDITATRTLNIANTTVTAGSYGTAVNVPSFTVNAQGQITSATNTAITFPVTSVFGRSGIVTAQSGDYNASQITNTPAGNIAATTVQAALNELDTEKAKLAGGNTFTGNQFMGGTFVNITPAPLNMVASAAGTALTQLNLVNTGGGGGAGSAIDFHTYDVAGGTTPGARISAIDDNYSAYLAFLTKTPGAPTNGVLERMRIANSGEVTIGGLLGTTLSNNPLSVNGTVNGFLQSNVQNTSTGTLASADMVLTADNGNDTDGFVDFGINNSTWSDPTFTINGPRDGYLYNQGGDMSVGTGAANSVVLFTGGTLAANERMRVNATGQVAIGTSTPASSVKLQIDSTTQGFLQPRMTTAQRIAIATPVEGLQVYDTDLSTVCRYSGTGWFYDFTIANTAIQSSTSTTYANLTEFVTPTLYPGNYIIEFEGTYQSAATTTGIGIRLNRATATVSFVSINWKFSQAANGTDKYFEYSQTALADNVTSTASLTTNTNYPVVGLGIFSVSVAGTIALQFRSETGTSVSIRPTSILSIRKV